MTNRGAGLEQGRGSGLLSMALGAAVVAVLAASGYSVGTRLAKRWELPPLPVVTTEAPRATVVYPTIIPEQAIDSVLGPDEAVEWQFSGAAGQIATLEMWLHPGSGSSNDAGLVLELFGPSGSLLANETGSLYLPPYVGGLTLPENGTYLIRVSPTNGAPGQISLALSLTSQAAREVQDATIAPLRPTPDASTEYAVDAQHQFQWPTTRRAISGWTFHDPGNPSHIGLDIAARMWDPIVAVADGVVVFAGWGGGYGNLVIVDHQNGWQSYYAHFAKIAVAAGQKVRQGELLGGAGTTGHSTGPHLHFELRYQGRPVDPFLYLP